MWRFSWSTLFAVTACSFLLFSFIVWLMEGYFPPLLLKTGLIFTGLTLANWLLIKLHKHYPGKKFRQSS